MLSVEQASMERGNDLPSGDEMVVTWGDDDA